MSLTCDEVLSRLSLDDGWDQTLEALLHRDDHRRKTPESIFGHQSDLDEQCRSTVISWLLELCSEQLCPVEVPSLAIDLMDRFLIACSHIKRSQLQLVAVVCLSLAAKMRDLKRISEDLLITYADYSVTRKEIKVRLYLHFQTDCNGPIPDMTFSFIDMTGSCLRHKYRSTLYTFQPHRHAVPNTFKVNNYPYLLCPNLPLHPFPSPSFLPGFFGSHVEMEVEIILIEYLTE